MYYIDLFGRRGPFDEETLKGMRLTAETLVSTNRIDWSPAGDVFGWLSPPKPMESKEWCYSIDGTEGYGPVTHSIVVQKIQEGSLNGESLVWKEGQTARSIRTEPDFQPFLMKEPEPLDINFIGYFTNLIKKAGLCGHSSNIGESKVFVPLIIIAGIVVAAGIICLSLLLSSDDCPSTVARKYHTSLKYGDINTLHKVLTHEATEEVVRMTKKEMEQRGEIKDIRHTIDENTAEVVIIYENGEEHTLYLKKVDGKWKVNHILPKFGPPSVAPHLPLGR